MMGKPLLFILASTYLVFSIVAIEYPYGPSVNYYPSRTPSIVEARQFDADHKKVVPFDAQAIANAVNSFTDQQIEEGVAVFLEPGNVNGSGAGSTSPPWLQNIGKKGRSRRILITPLGKWGSCTFSNNVKIQSVYGVAFGGFNFTTNDGSGHRQGFLCQDCTESAVFNMAPLTYVCGQSIDNLPTWDIEFVNIVIPTSYVKHDVDNDADTADFRVTKNSPATNVSFIGCYFAPSFREKGSKAHTDTLQISGYSDYTNFTVKNSVFFGSTNSAAQVGATKGYHFVNSLIIGSNMTNVRYPILPGADGYDIGYVTPNGVNGAAIDASAINSILIGSIGATRWAFQSNSTISYTPQSSQEPATGDKWSVDPSLLHINEAWIDERVANITDDYLQSIFNNISQPFDL